jgi:polyether ionophore transport system permease protein
MGALTGTGTLLRLAMRRDRIKLPLWIVGIASMFAASTASTLELYASDTAARMTYAVTTAPSIVSRVFAGPIDGPDVGSIVLNETFLFTALAAAFMSTLALVRHTRQNEETGRSELIGSSIVGRHASLTAALAIVFAANVILGILIALSLIGNGLPAAGSIATGAAVGAVGVIFAAAAAVTAQISESARGANSLAALVIGVAFLLRAIGDGMGNLAQNGMAIASMWPSWLSPIGWSQQIHPYTRDSWWIFGLFGALCVALVGTAFLLTNRRDIGLGMLPVRKGPATAPANLLSPFGLAWRLQKGILKGWAITIVVLGASYGLVAKEFETLFTENEEVAELMQRLGGTENVTDALLGALLFFMALTIAAYAMQALQRLRSEEVAGQLEPVLATSVSRYRWMLSHISCTFIGIATMTLLTGLSLSIAYVLASGESWSEVVSLTGSAFVHMPAILALAGFAVLAFGLLPRMAIGLAWGGLGICLLIGQFGALLELPQWALNVSPFSHTPSVPADAVTAAPLALLLTATVLMCALGLAFFRRRDLTTA